MVPPNKKHKPNESITSLYSTILNSISKVSTELEPLPLIPTDLIHNLEELFKSLEDFKSNVNHLEKSTEKEEKIEERVVNLKQFKDKLDQEGAYFWNKSVATKCHEQISNSNNSTVGGNIIINKWEILHAKLRLVAFNLVSLGSVEPLTVDSHIHLLHLGTKTALAFVTLSEPSTVISLLETCATHASFIPPTPSTFLTSSNQNQNSTLTSPSTKVLLNYYTTRINFVTQSFKSPERNYNIAKFLLEKIKSSLELGVKEIESLSALCKGVGERLVYDSSTSSKEIEEEEEEEEEKGRKASIAVEWLLEAVKLVENRTTSQIAKSIQISALKSLAQAYLNLTPVKSGWVKAEAVVSELLLLESSAKLHRRFIKLVMAREGSDSEIIEAFVAAASMDLLTESDAIRLLGEIHRLPDSRRSLRFSILNSLLDVVLRKLSFSPKGNNSTSVSGSSEAEAFLIQILYVIVFSITSNDAERLEEVYNKVSTALPTYSLPINPAFVLTTYTWRLGDKSHSTSNYLLASTFYLLSTHSILSSLKAKTWSKAYRKSSLCFSSLGEFEKAEAVMRREEGGKGSKEARSVFVRFYNFTLMKDEDKAIQTLDQLVAAPDFNLNMLLWAAKSAHESGLKPLLRAVLSKLLDVCQGRSVVSVNVDTMVLVRCLIRLHIAALDTDGEDTSETAVTLEKYFETALELATSLAEQNTEVEPILQNITWLFQTGYNLCARFLTEWNQETLIGLYDTISSLLELESNLSGKVSMESTSKLWTCRFASLSSKLFLVRLLDTSLERVEGYRSLLPELTSTRIAWSDARSRFPNIEKGEILERTMLGMEVEALTALDDWISVGRLVEDIARPERKLPVSILKEIAERVVSSQSCPSDVAYSVLKRTLDVLSSRKDLAAGALASWIRIIITFLLNRGEYDQAYLYAQNALTFTTNQSSLYSREELEWLCSTVWDTGLDLYSANSFDKGKYWCGTAIQIAKNFDRGIYEKLQSYDAGLDAKYHAQIDEDDQI